MSLHTLFAVKSIYIPFTTLLKMYFSPSWKKADVKYSIQYLKHRLFFFSFGRFCIISVRIAKATYSCNPFKKTDYKLTGNRMHSINCHYTFFFHSIVYICYENLMKEFKWQYYFMWGFIIIPGPSSVILIHLTNSY